MDITSYIQHISKEIYHKRLSNDNMITYNAIDRPGVNTNT